MQDICRFQAVDRDSCHSTMNLDGIGLFATAEDSVWTYIGAWRVPRSVPCRRKICEAVARSLKMNVDGAACRDAGTSQSFAMWTLNREAKSVKSVHSAGEGTKNSPSNRREEPYTSSAEEEAYKSSFYALQIPNRTNGNASVKCSPTWHINADFS
jgi:hypothetical protein